MANIVITGSTQGIGFGLATAFADLGHNVVICGRDSAALDSALSALAKSKGKSFGRQCDISQPGELQALWDFSIDTLGPIDIWINNAGFARTTEKIIDYSIDDVEKMVNTNLKGTLYALQIAVKGMLTQGQGKIFNILGGGSNGEYFPGMGIYGSTKRGLDYVTDALVKELQETPLIIGKVRPGMVVTEAIIREIQEDPDNFHKNRKMMNILSDSVDTVCPYLAERMLMCQKSGSKISWLTGGKISWRMLSALFKAPEDKFPEVSAQSTS
ncbi:SDR family oxidoreductase [Aestuariicella hydrocarbonica]|uniref:SDR family oxidoreductase n=1 Tax=Pseudomaricurvus hydrocarbonicus TaxID=1470433 RepID=A0A9E5T1Y9_9GAMM|nr:SDR family oxidoreductase [Aestuariicella hydrocarbonica]NHO67276.1 SDR family oxidoreductase [Aestuariicella hydrocarbonica]